MSGETESTMSTTTAAAAATSVGMTGAPLSGTQRPGRGTFTDDFNYPTAKRGDTMYLQSYDSPKRTHARVQPTALTTLDIPGAQASTRPSPLHRVKPKCFDSSLRVGDIKGASPKRLVPPEPLSSQHFALSNRDIEGTFARSAGKSRRCVDPNVPQYTLPAVTHRPVTPPPQRREPLKIDDIAGTRPHHKIVLTKPARNILQVEDLPRAKADTTLSARLRQGGKSKPPENPTQEFRTKEELGFKTTRTTNPLSPRYNWDKTVVSAPMGTIQGAHPKPIPPQRSARFDMLSLKSQDIPGAQPRVKLPKPGKVRKEYRNPTDISDIPAARPTEIHCQFYHTMEGK